jgi:lipopolysaccharide/colanic/teichoic acid biosynthesis glycosyltransferase/GGDEF domain-containing protein
MIWLQTILGFSRSAPGNRHNTTWLLPREAFQSQLERERMRADRSDSVFSLMIISVRPGRRDEAVERLAGILRGRIRKTDIAGWFDGRRIGVILPETGSAGAYKLASDLSAFYDDERSIPTFDIYTHPSDDHLSPPRAADRDEALVETVAETMVSRAVASADAALVDAPARPDRRARLAKFSAAESRRLTEGSERRPKFVEALLVQPQPFWKRAIDIVGASLGLVALSPVLAVTAIAIKRGSPGPIIFAQKREGLGGQVFTMYKFRTMCTDAEAMKAQLRKFSEQDGPAFKLTNDPRITPLGHFLRKTCIDELPQLWNVLRGEMSLVGPRPLPVDESRNCKSWQRRRLGVKPGLTCIWQVDGGIHVTFDQWMRMDLDYAASRSPARDAKLLWKTFTKVLLRRASR